ncbi:carbohydrate kinase family protein [Streptomyces sp. ODS05-4]|uniref:carbohydrate kinase family protein n=1 Tax=Streptomyces sp. ODS05-4 TaxID=2944939 RepID=UPI0021086D0B|nr:carbohydrate kinase family protein [Streptomyces sp. ODS05-4]
MTDRDYDVLVIGGVGVDTIVRVDELTAPVGDSVHVPPIRDYVAHTGNGVALGSHHLGLRTKFVDFLGEDEQGAFVLRSYAEHGLDFSWLPAPQGTPRSVNLVDRAGRRFSYYDGRHPAELRMPESFVAPHLAGSRHVHLSISNHNRDLFPLLRDAGRTVSTDLHAWDGRRPHQVAFARHSDLVFMSAAELTEDGALAAVMRTILDQGRARLVVATDGADGCHVLERGDRSVRHHPATDPLPGRAIVDSNGAGDAFVTGFLHTWSRQPGRERDVDACVLAGQVAGAYACGTPGTHTSFIDAPTLAAGVRRAGTPS